MSGEIRGQTDSILLPFLLTSDESEAESLLADLISKYAAPAVEGIVRSTLGQLAAPELNHGAQETQDTEDIVGEVNIRILDRLRRLKESANEDTINDFRSYVAATAHNACHNYVRGKYPNRTRLRNKLRYILMHHPDLALWQGADGKWIGGLSQWREQPRSATSGWINEARMDPERFIKGGPASDVIELLREIFTSAKAPIHMEDLVSLAAEILRITDVPPANDVQLEYLKPNNLTANYVDPAVEEGQRLHLKYVWDQIMELPEAQRVALLLAVRDGTRTSIAVLLSESRIASFREIAEAVGMSANDFAQIFLDLPLDDNEISKRLSVTRQQVISYRQSARRRLLRRMKSLGQSKPMSKDKRL